MLEDKWLELKGDCQIVFERLAAVGGRGDTFQKEHLVSVREGDFGLFEKIHGSEDGHVTRDQWMIFCQTTMEEQKYFIRK